MKVDTFPATRMIYVTLIEEVAAAESEEISQGVVIDYDESSRPIGIELDIELIPGFFDNE
jgi:uncharacterized protein YuzE